MSQTRPTKIVTVTNDETYDLATHLARLADSAKVVIPVSTLAERNGLATLFMGGVLPVGTTVSRADLPGIPLETWDGTNWNGPLRANVGQGAGVGPILKSSTGPVSITTNSAGYTTIAYPTAFPNATSSFVVMEADDTMGAIILKSFSATASAINFRAFASTGATINNTPIKVTWIAVGY